VLAAVSLVFPRPGWLVACRNLLRAQEFRMIMLGITE
jgi:hypothetical protein